MSPRGVKSAVDHGPLEDQIQSLSDDVLACRDLRHAWRATKGFFKVDVVGGVRGALYVERTVDCMRCGTTRTEMFRVLKRSMEKLSTRYSYPEEYRLHGNKRGVPIAGMVQLELYVREMRRIDDLSSLR